LLDADVRPGHAYVEVAGARIDVGSQARLALVKSALGLNINSDELVASHAPLIAHEVANVQDTNQGSPHLEAHEDDDKEVGTS